MSKIQLNLNGTAYTGWTRLSLVRSVETISGRFDIDLTDKRPFPVPRGGAVELFLYDNLIITGYTDTLQIDVAATEHGLSISGRDKTGDLVDCSALVESQEMINVTLREVVEAVIEPFGIKAIFETDPPEIFKKFSFQEETVFEAIERACRLRGVLASSNEKGEVVIQKYGQRRTNTGLALGVNVLSARATFNDADRFSVYKVYGQQSGDDDTGPDASTKPEGQARDLAVKRNRPKIIIAEGNVDNGIAQQRAEWEAAIRAARAVSVEVVVPGWTEVPGGNLWRENSLVRTTLEPLGIDGDMLIKEVGFTLDDRNGEKTRLMLVRPDAYEKQPDLKQEEEGIDKEDADVDG